MQSNEPVTRVWEHCRITDKGVSLPAPYGVYAEAGGTVTCDLWENADYYGTVARFSAGDGFKGGPWALIGISRCDETCARDWRDLQRIKDDLCGPEWEAVEVFPSESRLVDPSNRFYLWAYPFGTLPMGLRPAKVVLSRSENAPVGQRGWEEGAWPWKPEEKK